MKTLLHIICGIKQSKQNKTSAYLDSYISLIAGYMQSPMDPSAKDACLNAIGSVKEHILNCSNLRDQMESLLINFAFPELSSANPILKARACWMYGQFGEIGFTN